MWSGKKSTDKHWDIVLKKPRQDRKCNTNRSVPRNMCVACCSHMWWTDKGTDRLTDRKEAYASAYIYRQNNKGRDLKIYIHRRFSSNSIMTSSVSASVSSSQFGMTSDSLSLSVTASGLAVPLAVSAFLSPPPWLWPPPPWLWPWHWKIKNVSEKYTHKLSIYKTKGTKTKQQMRLLLQFLS